MPTTYAQLGFGAALAVTAPFVCPAMQLEANTVAAVGGGIVDGNRMSRGERSLQELELTPAQAAQVENAIRTGQANLKLKPTALPMRNA